MTRRELFVALTGTTMAAPKRLSGSSFTPAQLARLRERRNDPIEFARRLLRSDIWDLQQRILRSVEQNQRTAVKACHASGKTFIAAAAVLWYLARWRESIVVTTAPTWNQVERLLWGEIRTAVERSCYPFPPTNETSLKITPKRYAIGLSTSKGDHGVRFQGFHADHMLMVLDEAPGVDPNIWEAIEGVRAGGDVRILALGNPTIPGGPFYEAFTTARDSWSTFTISAFDTPNLAGLSLESLLALSEEEAAQNARPYLTTRAWVREKYREWGPGHPLWQSRVLGEFPDQAEDALLSLGWLEKAKIRELNSEGRIRAGLDVAGPGEDETVLTIRKGPQILSQRVWNTEDPRGEVVSALEPYRSQLELLNVDSIGIGWGMYVHLRDIFGATVVQAVNVGKAARDQQKYANAKAEYYWGLRLRAEAGDLAGMPEAAISQLAGIRYKHNARGQVVIESKEDARKRGVKSPDRAESVMLAFAENPRPKLFPLVSIPKSGIVEDDIQDVSLSRPSPWKLG